MKPNMKPRKCEVHPKYKAVRQPRGACKACWFMFLKKNY